jgi:hypothetical protein
VKAWKVFALASDLHGDPLVDRMRLEIRTVTNVDMTPAYLDIIMD